jgi:hypothetical protein
MAESQDLFTYDPNASAKLEARLSKSRLAPYIVAAKGDQAFAMKMYLWNARLSKAFLFPLQVVEVAVRNSINEVLAAHFKNTDWIKVLPFQLTSQSMQSYNTSGVRLRRVNPNPSSDDIVAALTFDFWSNLFRVEYDSLWNTPSLLGRVFPLMPSNFRRSDIQDRVARINWLRNRIAHHETIHAKINVLIYLDLIYEIVGYICRDTLSWLKANATVTKVLYSPPTPESTFVGAPLGISTLRSPPIFNTETKLFEVLAQLNQIRPPAGLVKDVSVDPPYRVVTADMVMSYIQAEATKADGYIDLNGHNVGQILAAQSAVPVATISMSCTTGDVTNLFFPKGTQALRPQAVLVMDNTKPQPEAGIIMKPTVKF